MCILENVVKKIHFTCENGLVFCNRLNETIAFCLYMTNKCKSTYNFQSQKSQIGSYSVDIGVYQGAILIFTIEAKILPTPKGSKSKPRAEHEYVHGKGAGIQRFRDGFHGVDNRDRPLSENGMIAYIKEQDFGYWFSKINQWILNAEWDKSEQLEKIYFKSIAKLLSKHPRQETSEVILHHFWVDLRSKCRLALMIGATKSNGIPVGPYGSRK